MNENIKFKDFLNEYLTDNAFNSNCFIFRKDKNVGDSSYHVWQNKKELFIIDVTPKDLMYLKKFETYNNYFSRNNFSTNDIYSTDEVKNIYRINLNKGNYEWSEEYQLLKDLFFVKVHEYASGDFYIETGNLVGTLKIKDSKINYKLNINSRFGTSFLRYLIQFTQGVKEIEDVGSIGDQGSFSFWLVLFLWKNKLQKAYTISGLPKVYKTFHEELNFIRGNVNIPRYINKLYQDGFYPCSYDEHTYNNNINKIISRTFLNLGKNIKFQSIVKDISSIKNTFLSCCNANNFDVRNISDIKIKNPFYHQYQEVLELSKLILQEGGLDIGGETDFNGYFFDVSLLFEQYIRELLIQNIINGFQILPKKFFKDDPRTMVPHGGTMSPREFKQPGYRRLEPDIIIKSEQASFIFDVKYKNFDSLDGINRLDIFQIFTYVSKFSQVLPPIKGFGFIYPIRDNSLIFKNEYKNQLNYEIIYIRDNKIPFIKIKHVYSFAENLSLYIVFLKIPGDPKNGKSKFITDIKASEIDFRDTLEQILESSKNTN